MAIKNNKKADKISKVAIDRNVVDYSKDPFFIKKNKRAADVLRKHGIPEHFSKKTN